MALRAGSDPAIIGSASVPLDTTYTVRQRVQKGLQSLTIETSSKASVFTAQDNGRHFRIVFNETEDRIQLPPHVIHPSIDFASIKAYAKHSRCLKDELVEFWFSKVLIWSWECHSDLEDGDVEGRDVIPLPPTYSFLSGTNEAGAVALLKDSEARSTFLSCRSALAWLLTKSTY